METLRFEKKRDFDDYSIWVSYSGTPKSNHSDINLLYKKRALIDNFINNRHYTNMQNYVTVIRTIFKDLKEESLVIEFENEKGSEYVHYDNSTLEEFKKNVVENFTCGYKIVYKAYSGELNLRYDNYCEDSLDTHSDRITKIINQIDSLKNLKPINLDRNSKTIIEIYKLFYNENPNFASGAINTKVQAMICILTAFNVSLECDYDFKLSQGQEMPISEDIDQIVNRLYPFGEISDIKNNIKLSEDTKQTIKIVGDCIRESVTSENSLKELLITMSKWLYISRYKLSNLEQSSKEEYKDINDFINCLKLVKKINDRF